MITTEHDEAVTASRVVVVIAAAVVIALGLKFASPMLSPILMGAFFAIVSFPAVTALRRRGLPNWAAITVTCACVVGALVLVGVVLYSSLSQFADELPTYEAQIAEQTEEIDAWLADHGIEVSGTLGVDGFTGSSLAKLASKAVGAILSLLSSFLLLLLLTVFFLVDAGLFAVMGERQLATSGRWSAVAASLRDLQRFFVIKSIENAIITLGLVLLCVMFDVPFPLLWGVIGFFLSFIPQIGLTLACIPPVLLAYATSGLPAAVAIAVGVTIINQIGDNVILPLMAKKGLDLSLSVQFVSFLVWTWILGPAGAILALPLTMVLRLILSLSARTRWLGDWLSGSPAGAASWRPALLPVAQQRQEAQELGVEPDER